jgi:hypothetical protein
VAAPLVLGGLLFCLVAPASTARRAVACIFLVVLVLLLASGTARPYYLVPAYPLGFAAAGVALEALGRRPGWRLAPAVALALLVAAGAVSAPLVLPLLPPASLVRYERALGTSRPKTEFDEGLLPVQMALQFGWPEVAQAIRRAHAALPPEDRARAAVLTFTFGEAAAVSFFGGDALPAVLGTHNSYWMWGVAGGDGDVVLALAESEERLRRYYSSVEAVGTVDCRYCLPEYRKRVYLCRGPRRPLGEMWPELKDYR